ncbi:hypothetical protein CGRA01v4_00847 [Colletotrichum graminicola]|nr:hypothetical protein CGRA01v4_00847 [Colletotrichum graminicola]
MRASFDAVWVLVYTPAINNNNNNNNTIIIIINYYYTNNPSCVCFVSTIPPVFSSVTERASQLGNPPRAVGSPEALVERFVSQTNFKKRIQGCRSSACTNVLCPFGVDRVQSLVRFPSICHKTAAAWRQSARLRRSDWRNF